MGVLRTVYHGRMVLMVNYYQNFIGNILSFYLVQVGGEMWLQRHGVLFYIEKIVFYILRVDGLVM